MRKILKKLFFEKKKMLEEAQKNITEAKERQKQASDFWKETMSEISASVYGKDVISDEIRQEIIGSLEQFTETAHGYGQEVSNITMMHTILYLLTLYVDTAGYARHLDEGRLLAVAALINDELAE
jgi:hypothetical protein